MSPVFGIRVLRQDRESDASRLVKDNLSTTHHHQLLKPDRPQYR